MKHWLEIDYVSHGFPVKSLISMHKCALNSSKISVTDVNTPKIILSLLYNQKT